MSLGQYARFLIVGAFVGIVTVGSRELIGYLLAADTRQTYSVSIGLAYAAGTILSFLLNQRFTFGAGAHSHDWRNFQHFFAIALLGLLAAWALSLGLRYGLRLDALIGSWAKLTAFAIATFLSSLLTYPLNSLFVFAGHRQGGAPASGG